MRYLRLVVLNPTKGVTSLIRPLKQCFFRKINALTLASRQLILYRTPSSFRPDYLRLSLMRSARADSIRTKNCTACSIIAALILAVGSVYAGAEESAKVVEAPISEAAPVVVQPGFTAIVFGNGYVNTLVWLLIFAASFATITFILDGISMTKRRKLLPDNVIQGVQSSLEEGDLERALEACEENPSPLSNILKAGLANITSGFEAVQEAVSAATDLENEKILQRINYLNLLGQIAPMLGLLGTVIGMVKAFSGLAGEAGAAKAHLLALAISGALWTTVAGLLVAIPALVAYSLFKNIATKLLLESQAAVLDVLKVLRGRKIRIES